MDEKPTDVVLCVGIDGYPLLGNLKHCESDATKLAATMKAAGNYSVRVLTGSAKMWEERATYSNIRVQVHQLSSMARKQDRLIIFFAGRGVVAKNIALIDTAYILPLGCDAESGMALADMLKTIAKTKSENAVVVLSLAIDGKKEAFTKAINSLKYIKKLKVILSDGAGKKSYWAGANEALTLLKIKSPASAKPAARWEPTDAQRKAYVAALDKANKALARASGGRDAKAWDAAKSAAKAALRIGPPAARASVKLIDEGVPLAEVMKGKVTFVMHRTLNMILSGETQEVWKWNDRTIDITFKFNNHTHTITRQETLPAGEYTIFQKRWKHTCWWGVFTGGPYKPLPMKLLVTAGGEHEIKQLNRQTAAQHGKGILYWDGRRICQTDSLTKKVLMSDELELENAKGIGGLFITGPLGLAKHYNDIKLYNLSASSYKGVMKNARQYGNRILIARACRGKAWLEATAAKDEFRNGKRALVLAEEAMQLAHETNDESQWMYVETVAAANAEVGSFTRAASLAAEALALAKNETRKKPSAKDLKDLSERMALYKSGKPYRH